MINLDIQEVVVAIKIFDLDVEVFTKKIIVALIFEIECNSIYTAIILMNQNTMVLL